MQVRVLLLVIFILSANGIAHGQKASDGKVTLAFAGNRVFSEQELLNVANKCLEQSSGSRPADESDRIDYCLNKVRSYLTGRGYLRATVGEPRREQIDSGLKVTVPVEERELYRLGEMKIEGAKVLSPAQILGMLNLKTGDIADGESLNQWLDVLVRRSYANLGYIQYSGELEPDFRLKANAREGTVDFTLNIDEGHTFTIRSIKFVGNDKVPEADLRGEMLLRAGEIFIKGLFDESLRRLNQRGQFEAIDGDRDVDYEWDQKVPELDLTIRLKKRTATSTPF